MDEYHCDEEITFRANLRAYRAAERVEQFYSHLKIAQVRIFDDSAVVMEYSEEPGPPVDPMISLYIFVGVLFIMIAVIVVIIMAVTLKKRLLRM